MIARLLLLAAIVALVGTLLDWRLLDPTAEAPVAEPLRPGYYLTGVQLQDFGADGAPRLALSAAQASEDVASGQVALAGVALDYRAPGATQEWQLRAETARVGHDGDVVWFEGDVRMSGRGADLPGATELRTERLTLDLAGEQARSDAAVTLALGPHQLQAHGLQADLAAGRLQLERKVHGQFNP